MTKCSGDEHIIEFKVETVIKSNASVSLCESALLRVQQNLSKSPLGNMSSHSLGKNKATWLYLAAKEAGKRLSSQWGPPPHTLPLTKALHPSKLRPAIFIPMLPNLSSDLSLETEARGGQTFLLGQILDAVCGQHAQSGTQLCPQVCAPSHVLHPRE